MVGDRSALRNLSVKLGTTHTTVVSTTTSHTFASDRQLRDVPEDTSEVTTLTCTGVAHLHPPLPANLTHKWKMTLIHCKHAVAVHREQNGEVHGETSP